MHRYPHIDVLRGFAALLVVFYHVIAVGEWTTFPTTGIAMLPRTGWIGVDLFFVISGFVIGKSALEGVARGGDWRTVYMYRRVRRIVPLYLATMLCYLFLVHPNVLREGWTSVAHVVSHLLFLHNLSPTTYYSVNGPSWSIALEMQFYVLVALAAPWMARSTWPRILLVWGVVAIGWRFGSTLALPPGASNFEHQMMAAAQLPGVLDQFAVGICLAKLSMSGHFAYRPARLLGWALAAVVLLLLAGVTFLSHGAYWSFASMIIGWRTLLSAGFASLLACVIMCPWTGGWTTRPLRYLGKLVTDSICGISRCCSRWLTKHQCDNQNYCLRPFAVRWSWPPCLGMVSKGFGSNRVVGLGQVEVVLANPVVPRAFNEQARLEYPLKKLVCQWPRPTRNVAAVCR